MPTKNNIIIFQSNVSQYLIKVKLNINSVNGMGEKLLIQL